MRSTLKFLLALAVSLLLMMAVRALVFTIYTVDGEGLEPEFLQGDHVMVNRWSYGLRTGGNGRLFPYGRLCHQAIERGDLVAYEDPREGANGAVLFGRCRALPGDTVRYQGRTELVPSLKNCDDADYYWIQAIGQHNTIDSRELGFISEQLIIGRAFLIVFSHDEQQPLWTGYRSKRFLLKK